MLGKRKIRMDLREVEEMGLGYDQNTQPQILKQLIQINLKNKCSRNKNKNFNRYRAL